MAMYTRGTRFAMPQERLNLISKFMRETYYPTIRGKYMLFDVMGRSVSRPGVPDKSHTALFAQRMEILDTAHAQEFKEIISRLKEENQLIMPSSLNIHIISAEIIHYMCVLNIPSMCDWFPIVQPVVNMAMGKI